MTRSTLALRCAPALVLLVLPLALAGCGGGDSAADPTTIPAVANNPTVLDPATAVTGTTIASTTVRPTSASTAPASSGATGTTAPASSGTTGTTLMTKPSGQPTGQRLDGTVMASPTCPVERPDQPCPPRPVVAAHIEVFDRGEHLVTTVDTDSQGGFVLVLAPGRYVLTASSGTLFPSCPQFTVEIPAAGDTRADILCDSGLR